MRTTRARRFGIALALVGLLTLPALAGFGRGKHGGGGFGMRGLEHRLERIELGADVRERVDAILDETRVEARSVRREMRVAHERMRALLEQDTPDAKAVLAQADVLGALQTRAHKQHLSALLQIQPLLTAEQREELRAHRQHRHGGPRGERSLR